MNLILGDCLEKLKELPDNSIDSIVTDPPYGLSFMNKKWDYDVPSVDIWKECLRVLKPGGHLLSFSGSRTYHRMAVRIEDAGFEIRDQIMWVFGSGFPKSHNIGKAVDKLQGNDVPVHKGFNVAGQGIGLNENKNLRSDHPEYIKPNYDNEWEGWGTALKPAHEPICVARKPLSEKTNAENVLKWGTGGINIDESRVGTRTENESGWSKSGSKASENRSMSGSNYDRVAKDEIGLGRWPANIMFECTCDKTIPSQQKEVKVGKDRRAFFHEENQIFSGGTKTSQRIEDYGDTGVIHTDPNCPCYMLDQQSGISKGNERTSKFTNYGVGEYGKKDGRKTQPTPNEIQGKWFGDKGGASRFFYCPKASKKDRDEGMDGFEEKQVFGDEGGTYQGLSNSKLPSKNHHPTVKPTALMLYLIKLVTPVNGTVLDCFLGSGSTGKAAIRGGFDFIGIEREEEYIKIAEARIKNEING